MTISSCCQPEMNGPRRANRDAQAGTPPRVAPPPRSRLFTGAEARGAEEALRDRLIPARLRREDFEVVERVRLEVLRGNGDAGLRRRKIDVQLRECFAAALLDHDVVANDGDGSESRED